VIVYCGEVLGGTLQAADDVDQAAFHPLDRLPPLAFRSTLQVLEQFHRI
jgi:hypothetical protein